MKKILALLLVINFMNPEGKKNKKKKAGAVK